MKTPNSVKALEEFGRKRLSQHFFMRDFLYSEISQVEGIPNVPERPDLAIKAGTQLCERLLEPLQARFGRIAIRSGYRSAAVNAKGAENGNQYSCASNEANAAHHIWDLPDADGYLGASVCIVVPALLKGFEQEESPWYKDWTPLAWWIHDHLPYSSQEWFPKLAAFNLGWRANPQVKPSIQTHAKNPHTGNCKALVRKGTASLAPPERQALVTAWLKSLG